MIKMKLRLIIIEEKFADNSFYPIISFPNAIVSIAKYDLKINLFLKTDWGS